MTEPTPKKVVEIVIGLDEDYNFMNFVDPENPVRLALDLSERCELVFTLSDKLVRKGWTFQRRPIVVNDDYGVNFSSYVWVTHTVGGAIAPSTSFKIIYECNRMGEYTYSLFMADAYDQRIDLDPKIENGTGKVP